MSEAVEYILIVDTNILLEVPDLAEVEWGVKPVKVYVLRSVIQELLGLSRRGEDWKTCDKARKAYDLLEQWSRRATEEGFPINGGRLYFVDAPPDIAPPLNPESVDHQQIALAQQFLRENPGRFCAIVTFDREMAQVAAAAVPPVSVIRPINRDVAHCISKQLPTAIYWFAEFHKEPPLPREPKALKPAGKRPKAFAGTRSRIDRTAARLHRRIRMAHHRSILTVAPLEMRLAVTSHVVASQTQTKRRVVFVFVPDDDLAKWWAREIYRRCGLPEGSVLVFDEDPIKQEGHVRVIVFRHDHVERRLDQYIARFARVKRAITAVVDGCDTMDPVSVAVLLHGFDQFIGFTRLPAAHPQARAGRLLDAFFKGEAVASYTFLDAECDGGLPPFEVRRHGVALNPVEAETYSKVNDEFLELHGEITQLHPELPQHTFWQDLHFMLDGIADPVSARLFPLREQREAIAQYAQAKIDTVLQLVAASGSPARCLVFDYGGVRTKLLAKRLQESGVTVGVLEHFADREAWESAWRQFEQGKTGCLLFQDVPPPGVTGAQVNRLIVLSPLVPMAALAAMTDWVLAHAANSSAICIDLLYTTQTPEQAAMREFADTCCGLLFTC